MNRIAVLIVAVLGLALSATADSFTFDFSDGAVYAIWEGDNDLDAGYHLWVGGTAFPSEIIPVQWAMADPAPIDTPEPGTMRIPVARGLFLCVGVCALLMGIALRNKLRN